jgi:ribose/xylose/arabinose/galactoside ABC-type transport system permease subunit/ABC-type branched-subunit amino acid transport system ATPase component
LVVFFGIKYDNFFSVSNALSIAMNVSSIAIAGVGAMLLVISGNVDLSIGGQYALISVVTAKVAQDQGNAVFAVAVGLAAGLVLGTFNGFLVRWMKISPLIVTLGTMTIFSGLAFMISDSRSIFGFSDGFVSIGRAKWVGIPVPVVVAAVIFVAVGFFLLRSVGGLRLYAMGGNNLAASLTGVRVDRTVVKLYAVNGLLMGVVGVLTTARLGSGTPQIGTEFELDVLTAVILGGVGFAGGSGHPIGVFTGVATIGILNAGLIFAGLQDYWQQISRGAVLLLALGADQVATYRRERSVKDQAPKPADETAQQTVPAGVSASDEYGIDIERRTQAGDAVLACTGLSRRFGSVFALRDGTFSVRSGEVVCIVGDNGAGKSTLIKLISGVHRPDSGTITFDGAPVAFDGPMDARRRGIETVHQDLAVCPNLGIAHNLVLGDEPRRRLFGLLPIRDDAAAADRAQNRLASLGITISDLNRSVGRLSGGQRQSVAIARAMKDGVKLVILDEPTAALGVTQTRNVLRIARQAAENGAGVILISHDIRTVFAVADRVVVLRLGADVHESAVDAVTHTKLLHLMAGLEVVDGPGGEPGDEATLDAAEASAR